MFQRWLDWFHSAVAGEQARPKDVASLQRAAVPSGMIQLGSLTFRLLRLSPDVYGVVRVIDDAFLGYFEQRPSLSVVPERAEDRDMLRRIACAAIRGGKTQWQPAKKRAAASARSAKPIMQLFELAGSRAR